MKKFSTTTKVIIILASIPLLTACGATGTASSSDYDSDTAVSMEIQDLGTEEYLITEIDSASTDEEKQLKYMHYLETVLARDIANAYSSVKDADVTFLIGDPDAAIIDTEEAMQANILLDLAEELAEDNIVEIAEAVATAMGSETDNITIVDTDGNVLYVKSEAFPNKKVI